MPFPSVMLRRICGNAAYKGSSNASRACEAVMPLLFYYDEPVFSPSASESEGVVVAGILRDLAGREDGVIKSVLLGVQ